MTAHAETNIADGSQCDSKDPRAQLALSLKFDPSELHEFEMADKAAGQMMGKLLTFLFCVLVFMMAGVNIWMINNASKGTDPQAPVATDAAAGQH